MSSGTRPKAPDPRQECDTLRECPKCDGTGEIRKSIETETTHRITISTCTFCEGVGCVPKWRVAR